MRRSECGALSRRELALVHEPLGLTARQAKRLIYAASGVDASIWRQEMEMLQAGGLRISSPRWNKLSFGKMIPWFECKAQLALDTGMSFAEVLTLTRADLQLSLCETRLIGIRRHPLTEASRLALDCIVGRGDGALLFPWQEQGTATRLWLRACRNAGLLRREPSKRTWTLDRRFSSRVRASAFA
jgi:hypothetical protein